MSEINRSYAAEKMYPEGSMVSVNETLQRRIVVSNTPKWVWEDVELNPGETFKVLEYSNAGFRGIEVSLENENGQKIHGVSAGFLISPFEAN
jgi:hypothetical protein